MLLEPQYRSSSQKTCSPNEAQALTGRRACCDMALRTRGALHTPLIDFLPSPPRTTPEGFAAQFTAL